MYLQSIPPFITDIYTFPILVLQSCFSSHAGKWCCGAEVSLVGDSHRGLGAPRGHDGAGVLMVTLAPCPQETRLKEGIVKLKPHEEPLRSELLSGKFTILVGGDVTPPNYPNLVAYPSSTPRGHPRVLRGPDLVSSSERAGPLGSLHRPLHGQAAPPQQERAARGAPGALLPAGPCGGEVSRDTVTDGGRSMGSPVPLRGKGRCRCIRRF